MGENLYRVSNMTNTPKAYPGETAQGPTSSVDEAQLLYDIIRERVRFPDDVRRVEFRLGEDLLEHRPYGSHLSLTTISSLQRSR